MTIKPYQHFIPLPSGERIQIAWPTPNHSLLDAPEKFFARTRVNPDYGKPGWTRDCGKRFHRGCDIAPVTVTATGKVTRVVFTDCTTGRDFESEEPTFVPHDEVYCMYDGQLLELADDESASDFGKHIVIKHTWPSIREGFFTLYAHLAKLETLNSELRTGQLIGRMGQTSRSADARNWMTVAPHLHFEVRKAAGGVFDPVEFLRRFLPAAFALRAGGGVIG